MARPQADVWLYGCRIGALSAPGAGKLAFEYSQEAAERFGTGSVVLSTSMPLDAAKRPRGDHVRAFFDGLLPEGDAREALFERFGVVRRDRFGLLEAIGRDCAGAVVIVPAGAGDPQRTGRLEPLGDADLAALVAGVRERPLGDDPELDVRLSLPGVQDKLLLARTSDGGWARPVGGAPSTHILKPQDMRFPGYAAAEHFCSLLARSLKLTSIDSEVISVQGRPVLVVSRYDRIDKDGRTERIHQEDACQALAVDMASGGAKYQAQGGPSLRTLAQLLNRYASREDLTRLLAITTFNVAVGNSDAHAKNLSIIHLPNGDASLAPAYDITPTAFYTKVPTSRGPVDMTNQLGMWINHKRSIHGVTTEDLVAEGVSWGIGAKAAAVAVDGPLQGMREHTARAAETAALPEEILGFVTSRTEALLAGKPTRARRESLTRRRGPAIEPFGHETQPPVLPDVGI